MRKKTIEFGLLLAVALLASGAVAAEDPRGDWLDSWSGEHYPRMEQFAERRLERVSVFLDLSDQQEEQWRELRAVREETRDGARERLQALHQEIRDLASATEPDAKAVGELVIQAHRLMEEGRADREAFHAELMSILTPEQQERFAAMEALRPERGPRGRHGRPRMPHGGPGRGEG